MADQLGLPVDYTAAELVKSVRDVRCTQLVSFIAATIVVYDYIVCFEREVELIWKKRWSVIKLAFIWHRYFGALCVLFQAYALNSTVVNDEIWCPRSSRTLSALGSCHFWFYWETWGCSAVLFTSEAVLLLWIYVIYNKNRWILTIMGLCYLAEVAGVVTILTISFQSFEAKADGIPGVEYCVMTAIGDPFPLLWVPILGYDVILLILFIYRGCAGAFPESNWRWAYKYDGFLDMIYRHSVLNFLAIFGSYLACALIWHTSELGLYQIPVCFALALSITNCTRLLLNIRRAYYCGTSNPLLCNTHDLAPLDTEYPKPSPPAIVLDDSLPTDTPDIDIPNSPMTASSLTHLSGPTLRELSATPTSTLGLAASSVSTLLASVSHGSHLDERESEGAPWTPAPALRTVVAGPHRAQTKEGVADRDRPMYLSAEVGKQWWQQYEMQDMRHGAEPAEMVGIGEAV